MLTAAPDHHLIARAREGEAAAVGDLFARHWPEAWRTAFVVTASRAAADDIAQDALVHGLRRIGDFRGEGTLAAWLMRIVARRAVDHVRRERRLQALHLRGASGDASDWEDNSLETEVAAAVRALRPDRRSVVVLHHWLGYSLAETSEIVGVPVGTVQSRLARALAELRETLGVNDG